MGRLQWALLAVVFGIVLTPSGVVAQSRRQPQMETFTSPDGSFAFRYPDWLVNCKTETNNLSCNAYMPICSGLDESSLACIAYPREKVPEQQTFGGAAFVVAIENDAHDEKACLQIPDLPPASWSHPHTKKINGVKFWVIHTGGVATGNTIDQQVYRTFHNGVCYELGINLSGVNPMQYDPPYPKYYDVEKVQSPLRQVLESFRFLK